jgi:hypothetical protein
MGPQQPSYHPHGPLRPEPLRIGFGEFLRELSLGAQPPGGNYEGVLHGESLCVQDGYGFMQMALQLVEFFGAKATELLKAGSPLPDRLV